MIKVFPGPKQSTKNTPTQLDALLEIIDLDMIETVLLRTLILILRKNGPLLIRKKKKLQNY